jgi:hypothetical protein
MASDTAQYRVEVVKTNGKVRISKPLPLEDAKEACEHVWLELSGDGVTARVSVIDANGKRITDLEC